MANRKRSFFEAGSAHQWLGCPWQGFVGLRSLASDERIPGNDDDRRIEEKAGQAAEDSKVEFGSARRWCCLFLVAALLLSGCRTRRSPVAPLVPATSREIRSGLLSAGLEEKPKVEKPQFNSSVSQVSFHQEDNEGRSEKSHRRSSEMPDVDTAEVARPDYESEADFSELQSGEPEAEKTEKKTESAETNNEIAETIAVSQLEFEQVNAVPLSLDAVLIATVNYYPEIRSAIQELTIAEGAVTLAQGSFDTKLKAVSENTPVGFYETYRSNFGIEQPTFNGGSVYAGYRFGRGDIPPWYLERNTNELGELKLGANWSLLRGKRIDARRVAIWQADLKRQSVEPVVKQQLILSVRDAEIAYWNWVAAGQTFRLNERLLDVARNRVKGINERIKAGDLSEITRADNDRSILSREVKLIKARAKLEQAAIKLSLYYRDAGGLPLMPLVSEVPELGAPDVSQDLEDVHGLLANAIACRPELGLIGLDIEKVSLDIRKSRNDLLPELNAQFSVSQDFGDPTSASVSASSSTQSVFVNFDEKDEFEVNAGISLTQSLQRRKAFGKIRSLNGKLQQFRIKQQFLQQKIEAEVQQNYQLTSAAREQIQVAQQSLELARKLSAASRDRYEEGDVDLFEIILREQQELDSAAVLIGSHFNFHANRANLNASVGCEPSIMNSESFSQDNF